MLPWPYPLTFLLETKRSIRPIPRSAFAVAYSPPPLKRSIKSNAIYGLKHLGREMDWNTWGLSVVYWFGSSREGGRDQATLGERRRQGFVGPFAGDAVTSIRQVRSSLLSPSSRAKTCTPYPNVSYYLYSDDQIWPNCRYMLVLASMPTNFVFFPRKISENSISYATNLFIDSFTRLCSFLHIADTRMSNIV